MIAVCDTSPINYLVLIGEVELLPTLLGDVVIPRAVAAELGATGAPPEVRAWVGRPPRWLSIREAPADPHPELEHLHPGEREVLALARALGALAVLDDGVARRAARALEVPVVGLLGLLDRAGRDGRLDVEKVLARLLRTSFRVAPAVLRDLLDRQRH